MKKLITIHTKRVFLLILSLFVMTVFYSCKKSAEKASEKMIEKSIGDDASVDIDDEKVTIKTGEGTFTSDATIKIWPKDIPDEIPQFDHGTIVNVTTQNMDDSNNWVVIFEEVPGSAIEKYKADLKSKGFKINFVTTAIAGGHLAAEKDNIIVSVMSGEGNAAVSVGVKK
ncbi:MAG: hypothetical protein QNK20_01605 [Aureibaculum sp.]|nr:hypothetical protein [Aureibaculum sp.]